MKSKRTIKRDYAKQVTKQFIIAIDEIKRRREDGLTADGHLAEALGFAWQTVHYLRTGQRAVTLDQLCALVHKFDVSPEFLLRFKGSPWQESETEHSVKILEKRMQKLEAGLSKVKAKKK